MTAARLVRRIAAPLVGGALVGVSLPPFGLWPLALCGVALLAWALHGGSVAGRAGAGLLVGIGQFGVGLYWANKFTFLGYLALVILASAFFVLACVLAPSGWLRVPALAGALTLAEWLRERWPFGGVPLGGIALGQAGEPLVNIARIGGTVALFGAVYLAGAAIGDLAAACFDNSARAASIDPRPLGRRLIPGGICLAVVVALAGWGALAPDGGPAVRSLRVAIVQGGGRRGLSDLEVPASSVYAAELRTTRLVRPPVDLVLWPEDALALGGPLSNTPQGAQLSEIARSLHTTFIVGITELDGATHFRNEIVAYAPSGALVAAFEKVHRVPFGEYVPWRSFFSHLVNLHAITRDAIPGHGSGIIVTPAGRLAALISYEVFFPDRGRSGVSAGGQLLLVPTNTSSYSSTQAPSQEVAASRLQAIEEGRDLLQAAPTGYSAVIDNSGDVLERTSLSVSAVLRAKVALRNGATLYTRLGDAPTVILCLLVLVAGWAVDLSGRRRERPAPRRS